jgi:chromate transporter
MRKVLDVFVAFLRLRRTSFAERRRWLDDAAFGECVALRELLPGPGKSQTGIPRADPKL